MLLTLACVSGNAYYTRLLCVSAGVMAHGERHVPDVPHQLSYHVRATPLGLILTVEPFSFHKCPLASTRGQQPLPYALQGTVKCAPIPTRLCSSCILYTSTSPRD